MKQSMDEITDYLATIDEKVLGYEVVSFVSIHLASQAKATLEAFEASIAALPLVLLTGAQLIEEAVRPRKGAVILVTGAVGSVGRAALFVARANGARVWAGVRGKQVAEAATLGADGVVALDSDADIAELPLLDGIADTIGGPTLARLFGKLKPGGTIGSVVGEAAGAKELGFEVRAFDTPWGRASMLT